MAGADARSGICCQIPYGGICSIADAMHICDDDLCRWCAADRAMLDALMTGDRAMLDAMLAADAAALAACGGMMTPAHLPDAPGR